MGSFNTTCFASQQTIAPGDVCVVVPIIQRSTYKPAEGTFRGQPVRLHGITSSTCYPTAFWRPAGGFFDATYDDYGRFTLLESPANLRRLVSFLRYVLGNTPKVELGENQYHDLAFDFPAFLAEKAPELDAWLATERNKKQGQEPYDAALLFKQAHECWDYVWEVGAEHRLFATSYGGNLVPLEFAVMHRAAYDVLVAQAEDMRGWDDAPMQQRVFFDRLFDKAASHSNIGDEPAMQAVWFNSSLRQELQAMGHFEGISYPDESELLRDVSRDFLAGKLDKDQLFELLKPQLDARYAITSLLALNIKVTPMVYAGQDYDNAIGRNYAKFIRAASAAVNRSVRAKG